MSTNEYKPCVRVPNANRQFYQNYFERRKKLMAEQTAVAKVKSKPQPKARNVVKKNKKI